MSWRLWAWRGLPATPGCDAPALGLIAHMDTSPAVSGADIHPEIVTYQGGDLPLKKAGSLKVKDFPFLERYIGQELIVTDGTTLLGADDKAGVAESSPPGWPTPWTAASWARSSTRTSMPPP